MLFFLKKLASFVSCSGSPQRVNGKVKGTIFVGNSPVPVVFENTDLHSYVVMNHGRSYTAISTIPETVGYSLLPLAPVGGIIGWMFAVEQDGFKNGFSITGNSPQILQLVVPGEPGGEWKGNSTSAGNLLMSILWLPKEDVEVKSSLIFFISVCSLRLSRIAFSSGSDFMVEIQKSPAEQMGSSHTASPPEVWGCPSFPHSVSHACLHIPNQPDLIFDVASVSAWRKETCHF